MRQAGNGLLGGGVVHPAHLVDKLAKKKGYTRSLCELVPSEISLRIAAIGSQFYQVKRMIRGSGGVMPSAYSQTLNG